MWAKNKHQAGFTIVELLIVVVVIAILAAITIVAYNGIQNRANDSVVRSDLSNIVKHLESMKTLSSSEKYPTTTNLVSNKLPASVAAYEKSRNNLYYCHTADGSHYALGVVSKSNKEFFVIDVVVREATGVWGSTTCNQITSYGAVLGAYSGYDNPTDTWSSWVR